MQLLLYMWTQKHINELNVCWKMVFRRIFQYNKWESVRAVIDGRGRLDVKHLILLRRMQFYRRIFYTNDNVLHKLFCALLLSDCMGTITAWYQFLHATQTGMSICNFGLILLSDVLTNWYNVCIFLFFLSRLIILSLLLANKDAHKTADTTNGSRRTVHDVNR